MQSLEPRSVIWVIDDSATDAERVYVTLREEFAVKVFHDGASALEFLATSQAPDLLLLDWVMPGMTGLEICNYIRSSKSSYTNIPIILLTAQYGREEIVLAFESGANDYIVKPFVEAELKARVRTLTQSKKTLERADNLVAELKKSEERLIRAKDDAELATKMKSAFLANMSHEIRTPLGAMLGFANLMLDPSITPMELAQYGEVLSRNGEQLSVIIDDILDLSKVEAGQLIYEHQSVDPQKVCNDVVNLFKVKAKEKDLTLEYVSQATTPQHVCTDPIRLRQIITNLVSNAVKFTQLGGIKIVSSGKSSSDGKVFLEIAIQDTGMGVPPEHSERIFEMFAQGDDSMTRKFGGTGIGLALSRQLARALGGDLVLAKNINGLGSEFKVSVLDNRTHRSELGTPLRSVISKEPTQIFLNGIKVLAVDDAPDNQTLLDLYLTKRGAVVEIASNGVEAFQKAISNDYDIVLMDLQMPQMDGYSTTKKLRDMGYKKPIIALTAHAMAEVSAKCLEAGCSGYLPKPINVNELITTIAAHTK